MRLGACLREIELLQLWPKLFLNLDRPLGLLEGVPRIAGIFLSELSGSFANWADMGWDFFRHDGLSGAPPSSSAPAGREHVKNAGGHRDVIMTRTPRRFGLRYSMMRETLRVGLVLARTFSQYASPPSSRRSARRITTSFHDTLLRKFSFKPA